MTRCRRLTTQSGPRWFCNLNVIAGDIPLHNPPGPVTAKTCDLAICGAAIPASALEASKPWPLLDGSPEPRAGSPVLQGRKESAPARSAGVLRKTQPRATDTAELML